MLNKRQNQPVLFIVPTGCDFNPQCPHVLMAQDCQNALKTRACLSLARVAILDGLGTYTRGMRRRKP